MHKGIAPLILILLIALGLAGGAVAGYEFREPIKKAISGVTTAEEITAAIDAFKLGQSKFELEGVATSVDATNSILTVSIKSSTASIKELRLSETPITITTTTSISSGSLSSLKITDIPIDSQVHVGGTIAEGVLTATKVIVQKDEANVNKSERFSIGGTVKVVGTSDLQIDVKTANSKAKDKKGTTVTVKTDATTIIEKAQATILLTDIKVGDEVQVVGAVNGTDYLASKIEVKVKEKATELEETADTTDKTKGNADKVNQSNNGNGQGNSANTNSNANKKE